MPHGLQPTPKLLQIHLKNTLEEPHPIGRRLAPPQEVARRLHKIVPRAEGAEDLQRHEQVAQGSHLGHEEEENTILICDYIVPK